MTEKSLVKLLYKKIITYPILHVDKIWLYSNIYKNSTNSEKKYEKKLG